MTVSPDIVLHVGAPKTGSTYLQKRLRVAPDLLRRHGIYVPVLGVVASMMGNAKLLPIAFDHISSKTFQRVFPDIDIGKLDPAEVMTELLGDWRRDRETLILSAENFRPQHAQAMRRLLPEDASCTVVLFVRRQDKWADSYFNQLIKTRDTCGQMSSFVERLCVASKDRLCCPDWHQHFTAWRDAFGRCEVLFYDEVQPDLFGAFLAAARLRSVPGVPEIERTQVSMDLFQLAYLLQLDDGVDFPEFANRRRAAAEAASRCSKPTKPYSLLSAKDCQLLRDRFEPANDRLMAALGRNHQRDIMQIPSEVDNYCDLHQLFGSQDYAQFRMLAEELHMENWPAAERDREHSVNGCPTQNSGNS